MSIKTQAGRVPIYRVWAANLGRVLAGVVLLFGAWFLGGFAGETIYPGKSLIGGRESLGGKIGCSIAILAVAVFLRRYLLRSLGLALACLGVTEVAALFVILWFSGLTSFSMADFRFNGWWLSTLTWNVVIAFVFGVAIGHQLDRRSRTDGGVP